MRYIANSNGYIKQISFGAAVTCGGVNCTGYTGAVPDGYESIEDWFNKECEKLYRWRVVGGNLTMDPDASEPSGCPIPSGMALLWENASPTSSFAGQTIACDLSLYSVVVIEWALATNDYQNNVALVLQCPVGETMVSYKAGQSARRAYTKTSGVEFAGATGGNAHNIPLRIYGIAGVNKVDGSRAVVGLCICGKVICGR